MDNKKVVTLVFVLILVLIAVLVAKNDLLEYKNEKIAPVEDVGVEIFYVNKEYGFKFSLPSDWTGYSVINSEWTGTVIVGTETSRGPKIIIRNPNWTTSKPYEDLPVLVFTTTQWNNYIAEKFSISAAPILATEIARNNKYVFALPPRWDFDYNFNYEQAQTIFKGNPIQTNEVESTINKATSTTSPSLKFTAENLKPILVASEWVWIKTELGTRPITDSKLVVTPNIKGDFVLTFLDEGTVSVKTDCNRMSGKFNFSENKITFGSFTEYVNVL